MNTPSRRYLSVWLRRLATDRIAKRFAPAEALVIAAPVKSALRLSAVNDAAAALGLHVGMPLADARAMYPKIAVADADERADLALLEAIADWCDRYTPLVGLDPPDGLTLDVTGCAHLFGGEAALAADLVRRLSRARLAGACRGRRHGRLCVGRGAVSTSPNGRGGRRVPTGPGEIPFLPAKGTSDDHRAPPPLAALRLSPDTVAALAQVGLKRIADVLDRPRAPLAARFGEMFIRRIDQALGREDEPITPRLPVPAALVEQRFTEPIALERDVLGTIERLAARLAPVLEQRGEGARLLQVALFRADGKVFRIEAGTGEPLREPARVARLFADRLGVIGDEVDPGFGFDMIRLSALVTERHDPRQTGLGSARPRGRLAHLIDRLGARFGLRRVTRQMPADTHIPEFAVMAVGAASLRGVGFSAHSRTRVQPSAGPSTGSSGNPVLGPGSPLSRGRAVEIYATLPHAPDPPVRAAGADRGVRRSTRRAAGAIHLAARAPCRGACRRPRAHRDGMVARRDGRKAHARLFPRREPRGRARLALSRGIVRHAACDALVRARRVRMNNVVEFPGADEAAHATPPIATAYAELAVTTNFSFLRGASHPHEFITQAMALGLSGIGIADRNSVAGVVRAYSALEQWNEHARNEKETKGIDLPALKLIVGARLCFADGTPDILAYPQNRNAWGRLTRLLTVGKSRGEKGECILFFDDLTEHGAGLNLIVMPPARIKADALRVLLARLRSETARQSVWLAASMLYRGDDNRRLARLRAIAEHAFVPLIAVNDVLYHAPERRPLQDVVTCIREHVTIDTAGRRLEANAERHLKPGHEMARLFRRAPEAIDRTLRFLDRCNFSLGELKKTEYPDENRVGYATPQDALVALAEEGFRRRYPNGAHPKVRHALERELEMTVKLDYAKYFLTVYDIVNFARSKGILCQGRGSAANSVICYCLGITEVDP